VSNAITFAEMLMSGIKGGSGKGSSLGAWDIAATLGLLAVGFIVERTAPAHNAKPALPPSKGRHASTAGLASEDGNRGRDAASPSDIPAKGWKDILWRVSGNVSDHRILALAAGMTYYSILAIFPALAALVAIYGLFTDPASIAKHLDEASGFIPGGAAEVAREQLTRVASKGGSTLGFTFAIGLIVSLWSANAAMKALFDTLNIVYDEKEKRGFLKLNAMSLGFTLAGIAFILSALAVVVVIPIILEYLGFSKAADLLIRIARWPAMFLALAIGLSFIYRFGPSRAAPRWRWITWGSAAATIMWIVTSALFSFYAANFGTFNETYGSLGAAIGLMTWLWISAIAILLGAELNAEMEHQTKRDTTTGGPKPLGTRGAKMADTLGAAR
jgi:membrane protein